MSTRAHIRIIKKDMPDIMLYHHLDGYPSNIGWDLKDCLISRLKNDQWEYPDQFIANPLIKNTIPGIFDTGYELTSSLHGDEEYIYVINCNKRELKCYKREFSESFEQTIINNNIIIL